jgi:MerR family transcriptional regulator, redox-sensitive transcriptional activator SoxR
METQETLTIGKVARQAGVSGPTMRYYESIGLLPAPRRVNGRRRYDASVLQRLRIIRVAQRAGFTLGEIRELFQAFPAGTTPAVRWESLARRKLAELDAQLARIEVMRGVLREGIRCGCLTMEQCTLWMSGYTESD